MGMRTYKLLKLKNFKKSICIFVFLILIFPVMQNSQASTFIDNNNLYQINDNISHEPINIYSLLDIVEYGLPGDGSPNNPYRIENYNITTDDYACIRIVGVKKFFLISNCYLSAKSYGIDIQDILYAGNAIIESNTIVDCNVGIQILSSPNTIISSNILENNSHSAILIDDRSFRTIIEKNTCKLSGDGGIKIINSINCSISDNTIYDGSVFENNESYDDAIFLYESTGCLIENNQIFNNGINVHGWDKEHLLSQNFSNNFVNDKKFGYFTELENTIIDSVEYGQLYLIGCVNVTIVNQNISNTTFCLFSIYCTNLVIENSTFSFNKKNAIEIRHTNQLKVVDCTISYNAHSAFYSWNCTNSSIERNLVYLNKNSGLHLWYSHNFSIINNLFQQNGGPGINLFASSYNHIHHNSFYNNSLEETINAYDYKQYNWYNSNNTWYDIFTNEGNYWDNANETGSYQIPGNYFSYDFHPLEEPTVEKIAGLIYIWNIDSDGEFTLDFNENASYNFISFIIAVVILGWSLEVKARNSKIDKRKYH